MIGEGFVSALYPQREFSSSVSKHGHHLNTFSRQYTIKWDAHLPNAVGQCCIVFCV